MSVEVGADSLADVLAARADCFVLSVGAAGRVKVIHAPVSIDGAIVVAVVGPGTRRNLAARPAVTLLWPDARDGMSLLADGTARIGPGDDEATIEVTGAVLHRPAPTES